MNPSIPYMIPQIHAKGKPAYQNQNEPKKYRKPSISHHIDAMPNITAAIVAPIGLAIKILNLLVKC
jgi:hypothetical protein